MFKWLAVATAVLVTFPLALLFLVSTGAVPSAASIGLAGAGRSWRWRTSRRPI